MVFDVANHPTNERSAIALDLYFNALVYANNQGLSLEKTSCLLGIFKATHEKSMAERMTIEKSFGFFKLLALQSSVHRPPYSLGILNFAEMKDMAEQNRRVKNMYAEMSMQNDLRKDAPGKGAKAVSTAKDGHESGRTTRGQHCVGLPCL